MKKIRIGGIEVLAITLFVGGYVIANGPHDNSDALTYSKTGNITQEQQVSDIDTSPEQVIAYECLENCIDELNVNVPSETYHVSAWDSERTMFRSFDIEEKKEDNEKIKDINAYSKLPVTISFENDDELLEAPTYDVNYVPDYKEKSNDNK